MVSRLISCGNDNGSSSQLSPHQLPGNTPVAAGSAPPGSEKRVQPSFQVNIFVGL